MKRIQTRCCIAGGGPAGMMLGLLLARAGVEVVVLEKHADFLRDFRGDTIHPSTLELMHELGWLGEFLKLPHERASTLAVQIGDETVTVADFSHLPVRCGFIAFMPQWDFLNFLTERAGRYSGFRLVMEGEVTDIFEEAGRVAGVRATTPEGPLEVRADLVIGADGRHSTVRARSGLESRDLGAPMDVLWFRLSRKPDDPSGTMGRFDAGRIFISINRGQHWQCAFVIPKGSIEAVRAGGLAGFHREVATLAPFVRDRVDELADWDAVKLLTVRVDRLTRWYRPGLLCIGDAAHAMSPVGGVGINLAIQDAVAAANILTGPLRRGAPSLAELAAVQERRLWPTRVTQRFQLIAQNRIISRVLAQRERFRPPLAVRMLDHCPRLRRLPARLIGMGVRPEHIATPEAPG